MEIVAFILFIIAAVLFGLAAFNRNVTNPPRFNEVALGLCVLTVGFIIQFCSNNQQVHF